MSRIALIGGHGKIALIAIPLLVAAGHEVSGIVRNPDHQAEVRDAGATPVVADVERMDTGELAAALAGHDVVVWSAGAGGGDADRTYAVDRDAAIRSMDAAARAGVDRYVMVSYFGARPDHGVPAGDGFYPYAEAKAAADAHLRDSTLGWTVLHPSALTSEPGSGTVDAGASEPTRVSRENVARMILAVVDARPDAVAGRTIAFNDGDTPIADVAAGPSNGSGRS